MSSLTIFLGLLILVFIYLLLVPIILVVNTQTREYYIQLKGLAKVSIHADKAEVLKMKVRVFFMDFKFFPLRRKKASNKKTKKIKSKNNSKRVEFRKFIQILRTFKIKRFYINIDTGDCIFNAKLFPLFALLNQTKGSFYINFEGRNRMVLHMQNRPINIIKSFIHFKK